MCVCVCVCVCVFQRNRPLIICLLQRISLATSVIFTRFGNENAVSHKSANTDFHLT